MTPRRPGSPWSKPNRERVAQLEAAGLMRPAGTAVVVEARQDGSWEALVEVEQLVEPPELAAALDADPAARRGWLAQTRSARFTALLQLHGVKRPETRLRHVERIVAEARGRDAG